MVTAVAVEAERVLTEGVVIELVKLVGIIGGAIVAAVAAVRAGRTQREMKPNGGSSMRDAIDRLNSRANQIDDRIDRFRGEFDRTNSAQGERLGRIERELGVRDPSSRTRRYDTEESQ
jgi:hypothetical protein